MSRTRSTLCLRKTETRIELQDRRALLVPLTNQLHLKLLQKLTLTRVHQEPIPTSVRTRASTFASIWRARSRVKP